MKSTIGVVGIAFALAACGPSTQNTNTTTPTSSASPVGTTTPTKVAIPAYVASAVSAEDRSADDRALDAGRKPAELLAFAGIKPGMKVAELGAGSGYTTELMARVVGDGGKVWAQNAQFFAKFVEPAWTDRLKKPALKNVVRVDRDFDDPLPPEAKDLDVVVINLLYHDTVWLKTDRDKMNRAVFAALKPGGTYVIVDHSARAGTGTNDVQTLHRIEQKVIEEEVPRAGFKRAGEADFLRNASDPRDWNTAPRAAGEKRGSSDRFVLAFTKP
jgi:predicted methyltransferase